MTQRSASRLPSAWKTIGGLPEFLQHVHQIQDQGDLEFLVHSNLESTLTVGQGQTGRGSRGIAAVHLFSHLLDHGGLTLEQTRPHSLVLRTWGRRRFTGCRAGGGEKAFDDLLRGPHPRRAGENGSDRGHSFLVGLLPFGQPRFGLCAARLDHGNALAVDGRHQDRAGGGGHRALLVEGVKVPSRIRQDLFQAAFGDGNAGQLGDGLNRFQKRVLHGGLDQAALEFVGERSRRQGQRLIERKDAGRAGPGVAHADEFHGSKDGGQGSGR